MTRMRVHRRRAAPWCCTRRSSLGRGVMKSVAGGEACLASMPGKERRLVALISMVWRSFVQGNRLLRTTAPPFTYKYIVAKGPTVSCSSTLALIFRNCRLRLGRSYFKEGPSSGIADRTAGILQRLAQCRYGRYRHVSQRPNGSRSFFPIPRIGRVEILDQILKCWPSMDNFFSSTGLKVPDVGDNLPR